MLLLRSTRREQRIERSSSIRLGREIEVGILDRIAIADP